MVRPILITGFNQKGGIGKTTAAFNLARILSHNYGKKVLMVDADPQSSLTALVFPEAFKNPSSQEQLYQGFAKQREENRYATMIDIFYPAIHPVSPSVPGIERAEKVILTPAGDVSCAGKLFLIPGSIDVGQLDNPTELGLGNVPFYRGMPKIFTDMFRRIGELNNIDIIIFDLSPNICGAMNRSLIMGSDYFYVPFFPDFLSQQAIQNLLIQIPTWYETFHRLGIIETTPHFLGAFPHKICTRVSKTGEIKLVEAYRECIGKIYTLVSRFEEKLKESDMVVEDFLHMECIGVRDFASLGIEVQESGHPISDLLFPHKHAGALLAKQGKDRKLWSNIAYRKILGVFVQNLKAEDRDRLFPLCDERGQRIASSFEIRNSAHLYDGWDPREMQIQRLLPMEITPSPSPVSFDVTSVDNQYSAENIYTLLRYYFAKDEATIVMQPLQYGRGASEMKYFHDELHLRIVDVFNEDKQEDRIFIAIPVKMLSRENSVTLFLLDAMRESEPSESSTTDPISMIVYYYDPTNGNPERIDEEVERVLRDLDINIKNAVNILQENRPEAKSNPGLGIVAQARQIAGCSGIFDVEANLFEHRGILKYGTDIGLQLAPRERRIDNRYFFEIIGQNVHRKGADVMQTVINEMRQHREHYETIAELMPDKTWESYLDDIQIGRQPADHAILESLKCVLSTGIVIIDVVNSELHIATKIGVDNLAAIPTFIYCDEHGHCEALLVKDGYSIRNILVRLQERRSDRLRGRDSGGQTVVIEDKDIPPPSPARKRRNTAEKSPQQSSAMAINMAVESVTESVFHPGLSYQNVPGDGHCLYHAVGLHLGLDHMQLRNLVATYIESHLSEFRDFVILSEGRTIEDYIRDVRNGREWADNVEIEVLMHTQQRPIVVVNRDDGAIRNLGDVSRFPGELIFICYDGINHYGSLILTGTATGRDILSDMIVSRPISPLLTQAGPSSIPFASPPAFFPAVGRGQQIPDVNPNPSTANISPP